MNDFIKHGKASIVIDGQFGSTGKGLAAAYMYENAKLHNKSVTWDQMICTTNAAPNAGHTTVLPSGRKFVTFHMPTIAVLNDAPTIYLNAGAIIDMDVFKDEIEELKIRPRRIVVHPNAAIITKEDKKYEQDRASGATKIASTQKGVGRALARKIMREGTTAKDIRSEFLKIGADVVAMDLNEAMSMKWAVVIETPQGMGLSLNNGFHPHCTSREVSVAQSLSDAGVHPSYLHKTLMTTRTFPIRVGNIVDETGQTIGYSGGVYDDQVELSWDNFPHVEPERTTVTKRVRRIFTFSEQQYRDSIARLRPDIVHIGFCDYLKNTDEFAELLNKMHKAHSFYKYEPVVVCSFGPCTTDVVSLDVAIERLQHVF